MSQKIYNVLFVCTGNSARSIMAECLLNYWGKGLFKGYSAGNHPKGDVDPFTLQLLTKTGMPTEGLSSESLDIYTRADAPQMDYVFTVCDVAASEALPTMPGSPIIAHWGLADPAAFQGSDATRALAYRQAFSQLERRIQLFVALRHKELSRREVEQKVAEIGRQGADQVEDKAS